MPSTTKHLAGLATIVALAAPALASAADVPRGKYRGTTNQHAKVLVKLGPFSNPPRVVRVDVWTRLACDDGTTKNDRFNQIVAFGPKLDADNKFTLSADGFTMTGQFSAKGSARGTIARTVGGCHVTGVTWRARRQT
jgi:hypothetical protein